MNYKGNEPAYPVESFNKLTNGITKRELFAAMFMQGVFAREKLMDEDVAVLRCIRMADALLTKLERSA